MNDQYSKDLSIVQPEPGTSLAKAMTSFLSNRTRQSISSILSHTDSNNDSEKQSINESDNPKYKTELCRNYLTYGFCSYSIRCQFAHGIEELRDRTRHPKYKTEHCRNFLSGYCKYGSRCQFLHVSEDSCQSNNISSFSPTVVYPTAAATIGTYLLTNMFAQSAAFGLNRSQSAALALPTNVSTKFNPSFIHSNYVPMPYRTMTPLNCGMEMQQTFNRSNICHENLLLQNQNSNNLTNSSLQLKTRFQSQSSRIQTINRTSDDIQI